MAELTDLPLNDQLLHGIGRVAQAQVRLEMTLRQVYGALAFGPATYLASTRRSVEALVHDLRVMLPKSSLDSELQKASLDALVAAKDADGLRHRVVHDMWWPPGVDPSSETQMFTRSQVAKGEVWTHAHEHGLEYVEEAYEALIRADIRAATIMFAISQTSAFAAGVEGPGPGDPWLGKKALLDTLEGRFDLIGNGGYRLHNAEPPPA